MPKPRQRIVLSGTICQPLPEPFLSKLRYAQSGILHFEPGQTLGAICPIPRSNPSNTNGLLDVEVRIVGVSNVSVTVQCNVAAIGPNGGVVKEVNKSASGTNFKVDFGSSLNRSVSGGSYVVSCSLPSHALLVSVRAREP